MVYVQRLHVLIFFGSLNFWTLLHQPLHTLLLEGEDKLNVFEWGQALSLQSCFITNYRDCSQNSQSFGVFFFCHPLSGDISAEQFNPITQSWIFPMNSKMDQ